MENIIYYFTGTGNALWTAEKIAEELGSTELRAIAAGQTAETGKMYNTAGVVFPVYMHRVPHIVARFIKDLPETPYLYAAAVNAGDTGIVFSHFKKIIGGRENTLSAGFSIVTPSNYLPFGESVQGEKRELLLRTAAAKIKRISTIIKERRGFFDREASFFHTRVFPGIMYTAGYKYIPYLDKKFTVDSSCDSCGICERICPVENITLVNGKPVWNGGCEMCFACINNCPQEAIQYGKKTEGLKRYRNPDISISKIIKQKKG